MSTISIDTASHRSGQSVRARRRAYAEAITTARIWRRFTRQHAPRAWEQGLLALSLLPHRLLPLRRGSCGWSAFWDSWAVQQSSNFRARPLLRLGRLREYARTQRALRACRRAMGSDWPPVDDAHWRAMVNALYARLEVVIETHDTPATTRLTPSVHFAARDVTTAYRAACTQPTLDALLLGSEDDANVLARPHDATTQPVLPAIRW